jgi:hypothetical protein
MVTRSQYEGNANGYRPMTPTAAPPPEEYDSFFAEYIDRVRDRDPLSLIREQVDTLAGICGRLTEEGALYRYANGKWSIKEVLGHLSDAEHMMAYWLFRIGRGDPTPLRAFDEVAFVLATDFDSRSVADLLEDFTCARRSTLRIVHATPDGAWSHVGILEGHPLSARAVKYIIPGHFDHHMEVLRTRYGVHL